MLKKLFLWDTKFPFAEDTPIYKGQYWNVILSFDQAHLGRCIVYLNSRLTDDPIALTESERNELWVDVMPRLSNAIRKAFNPDRINLAHLANSTHHVHWHVVPRYEKNPTRQFAGENFIDDCVGRNFFKTPERKFPKEVLNKISEEIIKYL